MDQEISGGKWYAIIQVESEIENKIDKGNEMAINVGLKNLQVIVKEEQ